MHLVFNKASDDEFVATTSSGSKLRIYHDDDEHLALKFKWMWSYDLVLSQRALEMVAKRNKKKITKDTSNVIMEDCLQVFDLPEEAMENMTRVLSNFFKTEVSGELK